MDKIYLNNRLLDGNEVAQQVLSRGFAFGYGVFETIKFIDASPCFFAQHLGRLRRAAKAAGLAVSLDPSELRRQAAHLFEAYEVTAGVFKIVIFAGAEAPQVALFLRDGRLPETPAATRLTQATARKASSAFTSRHKTLNYMESVIALDAAKKEGFDECVFCNELGHLTEASMANLFWVQHGVLRTPHLECGALDGIVRAEVIALAREVGIEVEEGLFPPEALLGAEEAFLTSSGFGPRPVGAFVDATGRAAAYSSVLLPDLRAAFLERERASATQG